MEKQKTITQNLMRKTNEQNIDDIINSVFKQLGLDEKRAEMHLINNWELIVGRTIANSTTNMSIYNKVLFIYMNSSVIRNELQMIKSGLIDKINKFSKRELIADIVFK